MSRVPVAQELDCDDLEIFRTTRGGPERMLTTASVWQLRQLERHMNSGVQITIDAGKLLVAKPGFIKRYQELDDFARFALELHDQFVLSLSEGVDFVDEESATVVENVKCPICSDAVMHNMVVCVRCKTPHCSECWEYTASVQRSPAVKLVLCDLVNHNRLFKAVQAVTLAKQSLCGCLGQFIKRL